MLVDICNGLRHNLPSVTKSAAALSFPKRERNCLVEIFFLRRNSLIVGSKN